MYGQKIQTSGFLNLFNLHAKITILFFFPGKRDITCNIEHAASFKEFKIHYKRHFWQAD